MLDPFGLGGGTIGIEGQAAPGDVNSATLVVVEGSPHGGVVQGGVAGGHLGCGVPEHGGDCLEAHAPVDCLGGISGTLAARTGATTKELMARLGHASPNAAMIYQHAAADRDRRIADGPAAMAEAAGVAEIIAGTEEQSRPSRSRTDSRRTRHECGTPPGQSPPQTRQPSLGTASNLRFLESPRSDSNR